MKIFLKLLLDRLDAIRREHPELGRADVREVLATAIYHGFILGVPGYSLPESLGMASAEGNAAVRIALAEFLDAAAGGSARTSLQRFSAFQDATVESDAGRCYEDYFGYAQSYEDLVAKMARPSAIPKAPPKAASPWWRFWKHSQPRPS